MRSLLGEWYRKGELMATQSGRILVGALDRVVYSSANYLAAILSDLAAALAFLALGLNRFSGPWVVAGGVVIAGFMSSGLLEYVLHRCGADEAGRMSMKYVTIIPKWCT